MSYFEENTAHVGRPTIINNSSTRNTTVILEGEASKKSENMSQRKRVDDKSANEQGANGTPFIFMSGVQNAIQIMGNNNIRIQIGYNNNNNSTGRRMKKEEMVKVDSAEISKWVKFAENILRK